MVDEFEQRLRDASARFGWSDESQSAAQSHADLRAREAFDRVQRGESLPRFEYKRAYNGADVDRIRLHRQPKTSRCATTRSDIAVPRQLSHDLRQVLARNAELIRHRFHSETALWRARKAHERSKTVVGEAGEAHG